LASTSHPQESESTDRWAGSFIYGQRELSTPLKSPHSSITLSLMRRLLTPEDVRRLVFESIKEIEEAQSKLNLPICPNLQETRRRLRDGIFMAEPIVGDGGYQMDYGLFQPPSTIILDSRLPLLEEGLLHYSVVHEVIHADDHTGGDTLYKETKRHILEEHEAELERGMRIVTENGGRVYIRNREKLAELWAMQYVDLYVHYRTYIVLREQGTPRLEHLWECLHGEGPITARLLTYLERRRGVHYIFKLLTERVGRCCLIDLLRECEDIKKMDMGKYTI